jgi:uncharacterized protein (DUF924 family)
MDGAAIVDFWFGPADSPEFGQPRKVWFVKNPAFDDEIRTRFMPRITAALARPADQMPAASAPAQDILAEILLLDQFTRNVFRNTARAFAGDARARQLAAHLVASGGHLTLSPLQRTFAYLPFEHSEALADQDRAVTLFSELHAAHPDAPGIASNLDYAHRHRDIIVRFGRFPHRNVALGRASTPNEEEYLAQPGAGF